MPSVVITNNTGIWAVCLAASLFTSSSLNSSGASCYYYYICFEVVFPGMARARPAQTDGTELILSSCQSVWVGDLVAVSLMYPPPLPGSDRLFWPPAEHSCRRAFNIHYEEFSTFLQYCHDGCILMFASLFSI